MSSPVFLNWETPVRRDEESGGGPDDDRAILDASEKIATIYAEMLDAGMSRDSIGKAMIGAVVHIYDAFGSIDRLPTILRRAARNIEVEFSGSSPAKK